MENILKILMLEDSDTDAEIIQQFVLQQKPHCRFEIVMTEEDFTEALHRFKPDVILSDNTMPQLDATEALKIFNRAGMQIPFILVTGTVSEEFAAGIIKLGADDYILKDRLTRLPAAIDTALRQRRIEAERMEAQKKLAASEEKYRLLFERNLAGVYQCDVKGQMISCNDAFAHMLGYTAAEATQINAYRFYFSATTREEIVSLLYSERQISNHETILRHRDGREVYVIENISLHNDSESGEDIIESVLIDITERRKAEEDTRFAADLLKTVGQAVIATDMNGLIIYWNTAAEKLYGWMATEAMGKSIIELIPAQQSQQQALEIMSQITSGNFWTGEFMVQRKNGSIFPAYVTDSPVYNQHGILSGIIGVSVDLTERKQAEANLMSLEKKVLEQKIQEQKKISRAIMKAQEEEKNRLGLELHDNINQILVSSKLYLSRAGKQNEELKEVVKYPMELIDTSIHEIRQLSRKQVAPPRTHTLKEMVEGLINGLELHKIAAVNFRYGVTEGVIDDELKLNVYRIIQEQVNNIVKHADAKKITILVKTGVGYIHIVVTDDGKGFNLNSKPKGLGIYNITNRIESYNGAMEMVSSPGNGCSLTVKIPLISAAEKDAVE